MQAITTIGLDIAKLFQVHGIDTEGRVIVGRQLKRRYVLAFFRKCRRAGLVSKPAPVASLVARTPSAWPHRAANAAGLREALCEAA